MKDKGVKNGWVGRTVRTMRRNEAEEEDEEGEFLLLRSEPFWLWCSGGVVPPTSHIAFRARCPCQSGAGNGQGWVYFFMPGSACAVLQIRHNVLAHGIRVDAW